MARATIVIVTSSVLIVLASFAGQTPNLEKALEAQRVLVDQQPYDAQVHNDLGNLLLVAGRAGEAEQAYRRAVELNAGNTSARFNLAVLMQQAGRDGEAMAELRSLLEVDAYHAWGHYQLGVLLHQRGDRSKAVERYARAFAYDPNLTFPENNPHIIDNNLSTEALLQSQNYRKPQASGVPRLYSNPERIVDLMLDEEDVSAEAESGEEASDEENAAAGSGSAGTASRQSDKRLPSGGSVGTDPDENRRANPGRAEEDEEENQDVEDDEPQRRVLTPASLGEGTRNQVGSSTSTGSSPSPRSSGAAPRAKDRESLRQAFEERFKAARERAQSTQPSAGSETPSARRQPPPARRPRYIPGRNSTGRLELELRMPEAPVERHASLSGSPSAS